MANRIEYFDDLSWVVDPNNEIENMFKEHKEKKKQKYYIPFEDGKVMEVDFKEDHEFSMLMEYQDELYDPDGNFIFNKKIVKNWEYYSQELDDFLFYIDKAKYLMRNYNYYKKELEYMRQGLHLRKMSYEMMVAVIDNLKFVDRCFETRLAEYKQYLYPIYVERTSFSEMAEKLNMAKSSLQTKVDTGLKEFARCLIAKDKYRRIGEKMLENGVDTTTAEKEVELREKLEKVGELTVQLKKELNKIKRKK